MQDRILADGSILVKVSKVFFLILNKDFSLVCRHSVGGFGVTGTAPINVLPPSLVAFGDLKAF